MSRAEENKGNVSKDLEDERFNDVVRDVIKVLDRHNVQFRQFVDCATEVKKNLDLSDINAFEKWVQNKREVKKKESLDLFRNSGLIEISM